MVGLASFIALALTILCCENAERLGKALKIIDQPDADRKAHGRPTPLIGGLALMLALLAIELVWLATHSNLERAFSALIVATVGFWLLGFFDDRRGLRPSYRLVAAGMLFAVVITIEPRMMLKELDFGIATFGPVEFGVLAIPLTLLCLIGLTNAINMADGKNGVVLGIAICWAYGVSESVPDSFQSYIYSVIICLAIVFIYNWNGRLFLGDGGSYTVGALMGLQTIYFYNHPNSTLPVFAALLWLLIPTIDCLRLLAVRVITNRSPLKGDLNHFHHHLARRLPWHVALPVYLGISFGPGMLALLWPERGFFFLALALLLYLGVILWATYTKPPAIAAARLTDQRPGVPTLSVAPSVPRPARARDRRLLFIINEARFFVSHRLQLGLAARERGWDVHIAARADETTAEIRAHGLTFHPIGIDPHGCNPLREAGSVLEIAALFGRLRPDIVHCITIKPVIYGGIVARLAATPAFVATVCGLGRGFDRRDDSLAWAQRLLGVAYRQALAHADGRVIFQNADDLQECVACGFVSAQRSVLIAGSGVDPDRFLPVAKRPEPPIVLLVARLLRAKGVAEFVEAARWVSREGCPASFVIVGEPPANDPDAVTVEELSAWQADGSVTWWGYQRDMPGIYARASIACLPTFYREGVPKALIEAAACGLPIVTTDIPGCRDICRDGHNGFLVPPRDVPATVAALRTLLADPDRRRGMGAAGRELVIAEFSLASVLDLTLAVYETAGGRWSPSSAASVRPRHSEHRT